MVRMRRQYLALSALLIVAALVQLSFVAVRSGNASAQAPITCPVGTASAAASPAAATPVPAPAEEVAFPADGGNLTVFAAASLTDAFNDMKAQIEQANPKVKISFNFAGSQTLVTQLSEGARADVFASANDTQMNAAVKAGVIDGNPVEFTQNRLAIVVPKDNPGHIAGPQDLAKSGITIVLAQPAVPVGQYARTSLCKMAHDTATYGDDFVSKVASNVVSEETDVKAVLTKVQLGQADAGIVYTTDVTKSAAKDVKLITIPDDVNVIAQYPIAAIKDGNQALANAFIAFVIGPKGQAILHDYGFQPKP